MTLRLALPAVVLLLAIGGTQSAAASTGPEAASATHAVGAAKKKCKKPRARHKGRCVRRCPSGYAKKKNARWGRKCIRKRKPTVNPPKSVPPPTQNPPAVDPNQVQLTRNDAAGQAKLAETLLLERASFGSSGQTGEYQRLIFANTGQFQLSIRDWNSVSGEIPRSCSQGSYALKEAYTYADQGGGVVAIVAVTASGGSGNEALIFHNAQPNYVYLVVNNQAVAFERNPYMTQAC
jgi:hypothetical protein